MSPDFYPLRDAILPPQEMENGLFRETSLKRPFSPFSRGKNGISQGVENRGSLVSVPLALRGQTQRRTAAGSQARLGHGKSQEGHRQAEKAKDSNTEARKGGFSNGPNDFRELSGTP